MEGVGLEGWGKYDAPFLYLPCLGSFFHSNYEDEINFYLFLYGIELCILNLLVVQ